VGNYILRTVNNTAVTSLTINTTGGSTNYPGGSIDFRGASSAENILTIYYDGTNSYVACIPDVQTGSVSIT
jgi:hypothetical protein